MAETSFNTTHELNSLRCPTENKLLIRHMQVDAGYLIPCRKCDGRVKSATPIPRERIPLRCVSCNGLIAFHVDSTAAWLYECRHCLTVESSTGQIRGPDVWRLGRKLNVRLDGVKV